MLLQAFKSNVYYSWTKQQSKLAEPIVLCDNDTDLSPAMVLRSTVLVLRGSK
jgi:hypothetical protein